MINAGPLLSAINTPDDLRKLTTEELEEVCRELRQYIIDVVSVYGGHFGASLGVVELTVALHYAFNTPKDKLIWDVGHQAYGHKIITGRRNRFHTNRIYKGISGFPKRSESEYDTFGVGHASTSISAALGVAMAEHFNADNSKNVIAVIGDGALTAGLAFEGLNHAGVANTDLLVVLNDNCMSIDPNVGAMKEYLTDITTSKTFNKFRDELWTLLGKFHPKKLPNPRDIASKMEKGLKTFLLKESNLFESLKFRYFGPVDGHDVKHLVKVFNDLKNIPGPKLLHCLTVKGKGFKPAEDDQTKWHATDRFDKITGEMFKKIHQEPQPPRYQDVFGHTLVELAKKNDKIIGITPAMPSGSSMNIMIKEMPERAFDVGIAEQHAVTFSAGLASQGLIPFCNIYSSFMQRAYDQVIHDVCLQNIPVIFCLDRAGLAGADGPTHHGAYDIAYLRCIPNMIVSAPMDESELRNLMFTAQLNPTSPFSIRYPRGQGIIPEWKTPFQEIKIGTGRKILDGKDLAIISIGHIGNLAKDACKKLTIDGISAALYDMRFIKPLDEKLLHEIFSQFTKIISVEDGCITGGFGSAILEFAADNNYSGFTFRRLGIPDKIVEHGTQSELYSECGYNVVDIESAARKIVEVRINVLI
ncbi:MAG: 1-deoxy-D-xylulose-5-phosphate synthase [Bacteroidetes bacterium RIFCSPLOWO2_12_FULL_37_12]|nr:MAG: 1-deoxy-D-xylulose-5-phosphate synthase [Bacteroidetes bacterium RIFCSPLOWO2_12_FULL_37_12]